MTTLYDLAGRMRAALERDDTAEMRALLEAMRRCNVGEAWVPGLRDLCNRARARLTKGEG